MLIDMLWDTFIGNIDIYEKVFAFIVPLVGGAAAIINWLTAIYATAMSSPVEVSLMTKKEQYKYKNSNYMMLWIVFSALLIYLGFFSLLLNAELDKKTKDIEVVQTVEQEMVLEKIEDAQRMSELESGEDALTPEAEDNVVQPDVMNAIMFIVGFWGILGIGAILILVWSVNSLASSIRKIKKYITTKNLCFGVGVLATIIFGWLFLQTTKILFFFVICIVWLGVLAYIIKFKRVCIETVIDRLRSLCFVFIALTLIAINDIYVWTVDNYSTLLSIFKMVLISIILSAVLAILSFIIVKLNIYPGKAKVKYYDGKLEKDLYLYFRFNDKLFVAGEKEQIYDCEFYYFVKIDEMIGKRLDKVSAQTSNYSTVYGENIVLQVENKSDIVLSDILNKFGTIMQDNEISMDEYKKTKIYIKPGDDKVYFVLPCEKIPKDKQQFILYEQLK